VNAQSYLEKTKARLVSSVVIQQVTVVQEYVLQDRGFFRARLLLINGDFVEVSEFFVVVRGSARPVEYRHQWMDAARQVLRKRWDNAQHHPGLANFPHHIHVGGDAPVEPGRSLSILDVIDLIAEEMSAE
jgi:hypothetical protein